MGLGFVLFIFFAFLAAVLAPIGMLASRAAAQFLTRTATQDRHGVILAATLFPLLCLGWGGAVFIAQRIVNEVVFHRDPGIGDGWYCPLPNGYALMMIGSLSRSGAPLRSRARGRCTVEARQQGAPLPWRARRR
jgi:hypothetical protein